MLSSIAEGQGSVCSLLLGTQYLSVGASPLLYMVMWQAAAMVLSPPSPSGMIYTVSMMSGLKLLMRPTKES